MLVVESLQEAMDFVRGANRITAIFEQANIGVNLVENASRFLGALSAQLKHTANPLDVPNLENQLGLAVGLWMLQFDEARREVGADSTEQLRAILTSIGDASQGDAYKELLNSLEYLKNPQGHDGVQLRDMLIRQLMSADKKDQVLRFIDKMRLTYGRIESQIATKLAGGQGPNAAMATQQSAT